MAYIIALHPMTQGLTPLPHHPTVQHALDLSMAGTPEYSPIMVYSLGNSDSFPTDCSSTLSCTALPQALAVTEDWVGVDGFGDVLSRLLQAWWL